jgi:NADH-quinone oxidoreductase subunit L
VFVVLLGIVLAWWLYGDKSPKPDQPDVLQKAVPMPWAWLRNRLYVDEFYGVTFIAFYAWWARIADWLDRRVWGGAVSGVAVAFRGWAQVNRLLDTHVVDGTFDKGCEELSTGGGLLSRIQNGQIQAYLRWLALAVVVLAAILIWSSRA